VVDIYNAASNTWTTAAPRPIRGIAHPILHFHAIKDALFHKHTVMPASTPSSWPRPMADDHVVGIAVGVAVPAATILVLACVGFVVVMVLVRLQRRSPAYLSVNFLGLPTCRSNERDGTTAVNAAASGNVELLAWVHDNGCKIDRGACDAAAAHGRISALRELRTRGFRWNIETCQSAAHSGKFATPLRWLRWLRANNCPWDSGTCRAAVLAGRFDMLQWCHAEGCPLDDGVCELAASHDRLDMLAWACQLTGKAYYGAQAHNRVAQGAQLLRRLRPARRAPSEGEQLGMIFGAR
jgi:hypothetical protein